MGFRRVARVDTNQPETVKALRTLGFEVLHTHQLKNCFDLLVSKDGLNHIIEVKYGDAKLSPGEDDFKVRWKAPYHVIRSLDDVLLFATWHDTLIKSGLPEALLAPPTS